MYILIFLKENCTCRIEMKNKNIPTETPQIKKSVAPATPHATANKRNRTAIDMLLGDTRKVYQHHIKN